MANYPAQDKAIGLSRSQIGRKWVTKYDPSIALEIVEKVAEGMTLQQICTLEAGMPHRQTFMRWMTREPLLKQAYEAAKTLSAFAMEEEALDTARNLYLSPGTAQKVSAAQVLIGQLRWSASRRDPQNFAEKGNLNVVVPIQITTSLDMGQSASNVTAEHPDIYVLDVAPTQFDAHGNELPVGEWLESESVDVAVPAEAAPPITIFPKLSGKRPHGPRKRQLTPRNADFTLGMKEKFRG